MFLLSSLFVCLLATLCKNFQMDLHEIFREGWQGASEEIIKFWWHRLNTEIVFQIREIRQVVNGHKSAAASSHSFMLICQMAGLILQHW